MMKNNFLKKKLESGSTVFGTWLSIPSTALLDVICSSGFDFMILDREHAPISFESLQDLIIICESRSVSPIVRTTSATEAEILRSLDLGTHGIQIPNVSNFETVKNIVSFSKFPPIGNRGFSPFTRAANYNQKLPKDYTDIANSESLVIVQIEGIEGFKNLDQILTNQAVDIIFLGLFDISKALGVPGQIRSLQVRNTVESLVSKILANGKIAGAIATTPDDVSFLKQIGVRYLTYSVDVALIGERFTELVNTILKT